MSDWRDFQDRSMMEQVFSDPKVWIGLLVIATLLFCVATVYLEG